MTGSNFVEECAREVERLKAQVATLRAATRALVARVRDLGEPVREDWRVVEMGEDALAATEERP